MAGQSLEAALYALGEPGRKEGDGRRARPTPVFLDSTIWHGRSRSASEVPTTRKPSQRVREWMKRSKSTRSSSRTAEGSAHAPEEERIIKIDHLGGGRVGGIEYDPAITIGLAELAVAVRSPKHRNLSDNSPETRVTQWIDLYPEALEAFSPTYPPQEQQPDTVEERPSSPVPEKPQDQGSKPEDDLHPAPLRCPSMEKKDKDDKEDDGKTSEKPPVRKNPRWKPLPELPTPPADGAKPSPEAPFGTPPPTPDSETGAAKLEAEVIDSEPTPEPRVRERDSNDSKASEFSIPIKATIISPRPGTVKYTRQERVWLHNNYRGEAPFLQAWGLDIKSAEDREEGLEMLRELMAAEKEEAERREREGRGKGKEIRRKEVPGDKGGELARSGPKEGAKDTTKMNFLDV